MRKIRVLSALLVLTVLAPLASTAMDFTLDVPKGQSMIVKVPHSLWTREKLDAMSGQAIYTVEIDGAFMTGHKWEQGDVPPLFEFRLEKTEDCGRMRYDCKLKGYRQVELRAETVWLKLRFAPDVANPDAAFHELVSLGKLSDFESSDYFKTKVFAVQSQRIFSGPLATLPDAARLQLFLASLHSGAESLGSETYKGKTYLVVKLSEGDSVYNTLRLNQSARTSKVVNEQLLNMLKKFGSSLPADGNLFGLKLEEKIPYRDFAQESDPIHYDQLQVYAPSEMIRKFSDADITSQQFIDGCAVLVNDNRVQVNLSTS